MEEKDLNKGIRILKSLSEYLTAFGTAVLAFVAYFVSQFIVYLIFETLNIDTNLYEGLYSFCYSLGTVLMMLAFVFIEGKLNKKKGCVLKVQKTNPVNFFLIAVFAVGMIGITTLYMMGAQYLSSMNDTVSEALTDYTESVDRYAVVEQAQVPFWDNILYYAAITLVVPMSEELVFRASIFGYLERKFNSIVAILLSTVIFALLHVHLIQIGYAFICGLFIATVYYETRNIFASFMLHSIFNLLGSTVPQMAEDGVFQMMGISAEATTAFQNCLVYWELLLILPAILSFILIVQLGRKERKASVNE